MMVRSEGQEVSSGLDDPIVVIGLRLHEVYQSFR